MTVCLGSDATAPDRSGDMFRHMQQCMHYHRTFFHDPSWLPPGKVLEMCTIDGAARSGWRTRSARSKSARRPTSSSSICAGRTSIPLNMPEFRAVYFANGNDVHTVIVDGKIVLRDRKALTVDEDAILDAADRETELMIDRLGLRDLLQTPDTFWKHVRAIDQTRHH